MDNSIRNSVLIVDDEKSNILYLNSILSADYEIYTAKDGPRALELANEFVPDLILLDIIMPDMDGYEIIKALKSSDATKDIPVIFVTGLSGSAEESKGLILGAEDYIAKPFNDEIVRLRVRNQIKIVNQMRAIIEQELAEHKLRIKTQFLSRINHEMLTPMNAIIGLTNVAQMEDDIDAIQGYLDTIESSSKDLLNLIQNVLELDEDEEKPTELYGYSEEGENSTDPFG